MEERDSQQKNIYMEERKILKVLLQKKRKKRKKKEEEDLRSLKNEKDV